MSASANGNPARRDTSLAPSASGGVELMQRKWSDWSECSEDCVQTRIRLNCDDILLASGRNNSQQQAASGAHGSHQVSKQTLSLSRGTKVNHRQPQHLSKEANFSTTFDQNDEQIKPKPRNRRQLAGELIKPPLSPPGQPLIGSTGQQQQQQADDDVDYADEGDEEEEEDSCANVDTRKTFEKRRCRSGRCKLQLAPVGTDNLANAHQLQASKPPSARLQQKQQLQQQQQQQQQTATQRQRTQTTNKGHHTSLVIPNEYQRPSAAGPTQDDWLQPINHGHPVAHTDTDGGPYNSLDSDDSSAPFRNGLNGTDDQLQAGRLQPTDGINQHQQQQQQQSVGATTVGSGYPMGGSPSGATEIGSSRLVVGLARDTSATSGASDDGGTINASTWMTATMRNIWPPMPTTIQLHATNSTSNSSHPTTLPSLAHWALLIGFLLSLVVFIMLILRKLLFAPKSADSYRWMLARQRAGAMGSSPNGAAHFTTGNCRSRGSLGANGLHPIGKTKFGDRKWFLHQGGNQMNPAVQFGTPKASHWLAADQTNGLGRGDCVGGEQMLADGGGAAGLLSFSQQLTTSACGLGGLMQPFTNASTTGAPGIDWRPSPSHGCAAKIQSLCRILSENNVDDDDDNKFNGQPARQQFFAGHNSSGGSCGKLIGERSHSFTSEKRQIYLDLEGRHHFIRADSTSNQPKVGLNYTTTSNKSTSSHGLLAQKQTQQTLQNGVQIDLVPYYYTSPQHTRDGIGFDDKHNSDYTNPSMESATNQPSAETIQKHLKQNKTNKYRTPLTANEQKQQLDYDVTSSRSSSTSHSESTAPMLSQASSTSPSNKDPDDNVNDDDENGRHHYYEEIG